MNRALSLSLAAGLLSVVALLYLLAQAGPAAPLAAAGPTADIQAFEAPLDPNGYPLEVNRDPTGHLWVSDYEIGLTGQGEVWQIDPATGVYTLYHGMNAPSDARGDGAGTLWWADIDNKRIGRLSLGQQDADLWQLGGSGGLYGTAIDGVGRFWAADSGEPMVHSLEPTDNTLCAYEFPSAGSDSYLIVQGVNVWYADRTDGYLYRLEPDGPTLVRWQLPGGASPGGLAFDSSDRLWWSDLYLEALMRLDPDLDQLTVYALSDDAWPPMVAAAGQRMWFTEGWLYGAVGLLDPWETPAYAQTLSRGAVAVTTTCITRDPDLTMPLTVTHGTLAWTERAYSTTTVITGTWAANLPESLLPWGVAADSTGTWVVDSERRLLVRLAPLPVDLQACVVEDGDGDLTTTNDRTPLVGWTVSLFVDGAQQQPGQSTGTDGCAIWEDLPVGQTYQVAADTQAGWLALDSGPHDFGLLPTGAKDTHTFYRFETVDVTACKFEDQAGDGPTPDDPAYEQGWQISLTVNGAVVDTQTTDAAGCATWHGLGPLVEGGTYEDADQTIGPLPSDSAYGVSEAQVPGWVATTPVDLQFAPPTSGDAFQADYANFRGVQVTACVLGDEDGLLDTADDRAPEVGWMVHLRAGGESQQPGQETGIDGCYTWTGLGPGAYGVEQALPKGWTALAGTEEGFGSVRSGEAYTHTFVNTADQGSTVYLPLVLR